MSDLETAERFSADVVHGRKTGLAPRTSELHVPRNRSGRVLRLEAARDRLNDGRRVRDVLTERLIAAGVDRVDDTRRRRPPARGNRTVLPHIQPGVRVLRVHVCRAPLRARGAVRHRAGLRAESHQQKNRDRHGAKGGDDQRSNLVGSDQTPNRPGREVRRAECRQRVGAHDENTFISLRPVLTPPCLRTQVAATASLARGPGLIAHGSPDRQGERAERPNARSARASEARGWEVGPELGAGSGLARRPGVPVRAHRAIRGVVLYLSARRQGQR